MKPTTDTPAETTTLVAAETSKSVLFSKTVWLQLITLLSLFIPPVAKFLRDNPVEVVAFITALNLLLRFVTSGRVRLFPEEPLPSVEEVRAKPFPSTNGTDKVAVWCVMACMASVTLGGVLTSCKAIEPGTPVTGSVFYRDKSGAKAGISITGTPRQDAVK